MLVLCILLFPPAFLDKLISISFTNLVIVIQQIAMSIWLRVTMDNYLGVGIHCIQLCGEKVLKSVLLDATTFSSKSIEIEERTSEVILLEIATFGLESERLSMTIAVSAMSDAVGSIWLLLRCTTRSALEVIPDTIEVVPDE